MASTVKDGKIIKSLNKGTMYDELKKKYKTKKLKNADANKEARDKNYKNFNFENNPEFALSLLPAGKVLSKIPGVKTGVTKVSKLLSKTKKVKPEVTKVSKISKRKLNKINKKIKEVNKKKGNKTPILKNQKTNKPLATNKIRNNIIKGALVAGGGYAASTALPDGNKSKIIKKANANTVKEPKIKKSITPKIKKEILKKSEPVKNYTGKFVNKKGEVAYDSIGDFFKNMTGTAKKRVAPKNRKRISAETKGATKGLGFSGKSVAEFKNPFKKNVGGSLKSVPKNNTGLGKLPAPVRNKMGFMKKGGIVKMKGGGAATKGMNFNRGY